MTRKERYGRVLEYFTIHMPVAETELFYNDPFELVVATILSAQCTDKRVNMITPSLLRRYPDAISMSEASPDDIYEFIKSCSYPNSKARHLSEMSKMIVKDFAGEIPSDPALLQKLPGVGRKTANVVASVIYKKPVMAVDTHVFRVSERIGLTTNSKSPLQTELELTKNIPEELIYNAHHWLILHGRYVCKSRNPLCSQCGLTEFCRYYCMKLKK